MSAIRRPIPHDEYASFIGECECKHCRERYAREIRLHRDEPPVDDFEEHDEALEFGGIDL